LPECQAAWRWCDFRQSAQTLAADDVTLVLWMSKIDDPIDALVDPFVMILLEVLKNSVSQLASQMKW
jgi:hypothetical protein